MVGAAGRRGGRPGTGVLQRHLGRPMGADPFAQDPAKWAQCPTVLLSWPCSSVREAPSAPGSFSSSMRAGRGARWGWRPSHPTALPPARSPGPGSQDSRPLSSGLEERPGDSSTRALPETGSAHCLRLLLTQPFANQWQGHALGRSLEHLLSPFIHLHNGADNKTNLC